MFRALLRPTDRGDNARLNLRPRLVLATSASFAEPTVNITFAAMLSRHVTEMIGAWVLAVVSRVGFLGQLGGFSLFAH